jgi:transforming growth factor-beta-induced protein
MTGRVTIYIYLICIFMVSACSNAAQQAPTSVPRPTATSGTILDVLQADGRFTTLLRIFGAMSNVISSPGDPLTLFAPTDDAFAAWSSNALSNIQASELNRAAFFFYHMAPGKVFTETLVTTSTLNAVAGDTLTVTVEDGMVKVNGGTIILANIETSNGVIHVVDKVLLELPE